MHMSEPQKWEPPEFGSGDTPLERLIAGGNKRARDIEATVSSENNLVMRARNMFVSSRAKGDHLAMKEWAIIGVALANTPQLGDTSWYD